MIKISLLAILILCCHFDVSDSFAKNAWVDNKEICEKSGGNWRLFNNTCGDSCENKFALPVCTSILIYNCDCDNNSCFDGDKCISDEIAQKFWEDIEEKNKAKRKKELEDLKDNLQATKITPTNNSKPKTIPPLQNITPTNSTQSLQPTIAEVINNPGLIDPVTAKINSDQKLLCAKQSGVWQEFQNSCADNCRNKISKISICTDEKTFACKCENDKCWDDTKKSCIEIEEYRNSMNNKLITNSPIDFLNKLNQ